jgi:hypothetical protein
MTRRVQSARANGSLGGKQGSSNLTDEEREHRARIAGVATLDQYGRDYYSYLGSLPRLKPKSKKPIEPAKLSIAARRIAAMSLR